MSEGREQQLIVSYETVFDLLRREKNRSELQTLPPHFITEVCDYLHAKKTLLHKGFDADVPVEEKQKLMIHMQNMKKLVRELHDRRETKILYLAQNKIRTGNLLVDKDAMLPEETILFDSLVTLLDTSRKQVLGKMAGALGDQQLFSITFEAPIPEAVKPPDKEEPISQHLRFLQPVPKFVGRDLQTYGPYEKEDVASLPRELASILISKGRAEEIKVDI